VLSVRHGPRAGHDPWLGATLEWFALSPPPEHNFDAIPDVRSAEPLRDIREAVRRGTEGWSVPAPRRRAPVASEAPGSGEPGAAPATTDAERGGGRESPDSLSA
jgi:heme/copper-type cytochrome/quinol oxidase subunit 1